MRSLLRKIPLGKLRTECKQSRKNVPDIKLDDNFYPLCSQCFLPAIARLKLDQARRAGLWLIRIKAAAACLPSLLTSPAFKHMQIAADRRGGRVSAP
jgi:hypothetical protein